MNDRVTLGEVTPWFSFRKPPAREGLYQVWMEGLTEIEHQLWFDGRWVFPPRGLQSDLRQTPMGNEHGDKWRGLVRPVDAITDRILVAETTRDKAIDAALRGLAIAIDCTPTGQVRSLLTEANIHLRLANEAAKKAASKER